MYHGFLRFANGTFTTYDPPGAGTGPGQGDYGESINAAGEIAGEYSDASGVFHGFLRAPSGAFTTIDAPGAGTGPGQGTFVATVSGITAAGAITGYYFDGSGVAHGYVRSPSGTITTFDAPGAGTGASQGTYVGSINPKGEITSFFVDANNVYHGYLRTREGVITTIDAPGAGTGATQGTQAENINSIGYDRWKLLGYQRCESWFPAHHARHLHHVRRSKRWHRSRPGHDSI